MATRRVPLLSASETLTTVRVPPRVAENWASAVGATSMYAGSLLTSTIFSVSAPWEAMTVPALSNSATVIKG